MDTQKILVIIGCEPYDGTDKAWNALRLTAQLLNDGNSVTLFLLNDAVDLARPSVQKPESYDQDLGVMVDKLIVAGASVEVCGTCMNRCGIGKNSGYKDTVITSTMKRLSQFVVENDKVLTF